MALLLNAGDAVSRSYSYTQPSPLHPIQPQETGERTGNLFDKSTISTGHYAITTGIRENSSYYCSDFIPITATTYYFQNVVGGSYQNSVVVYDANKQGLRYEKLTGRDEASGAITFENGDAYIRINCYSLTDVDTVMLNAGSTALPYEPYGFKISISSANTTTPVYLGEVESTRQIKKFVLTGNDGGAWSHNVTIRNGNGFYNPNIFTGYKANSGAGYCTHYPLATAITDTIGVFFGGNINFITDFAEGIDTADKWKSYLQQQYAAGTPVTVWYVLATPTTGIVNEPIRKIGDYADTISNVAEIPTTAGSQTFDVDTSLKPSSAEITYKGWHKHTPKEYDNGSWS